MSNNVESPEVPLRIRNIRPREEEVRVETTVKKKINFSETDSDSENEVFIDCHAHKKGGQWQMMK